MANANIQITLHNADMLEGTPSYEPGSVVQGTVHVTPQEDIKCNHVWVRLGWHTEGRGTRAEKVIEQMDIAQGVLSAHTPISRSFNFNAPREPWSYAGHYINIVWEVKVTIDIPLATDVNQSLPFVVTPRR
jgi:hypothetical protein